MSDFLFGSICLSQIPKELIKEVQCKDGVTRKFLDITVSERREVSKYGFTHYISCAPKRELRKDGVNYYIADLKKWDEDKVQGMEQRMPAQSASASSPSLQPNGMVDGADVLPF